VVLDTEKDFLITTTLDILSTHLDVMRDKVRLSSRFKEELGADELDPKWIVESLESALQIQIPNDPQAGILTVGDLVLYLAELKHISGMREYLEIKYPEDMRVGM